MLPRLAVLAAATMAVLATSLAVTALSCTPKLWLAFAVGTLLVGLTYACIGVIAGSLFGQLGAHLPGSAFRHAQPGLLQNPMFGSGTPTGLALFLPDHGATRIAIDGGFSASFHARGELALALGWLALLSVAVTLVLRHHLRPMSG